MNVKDLAIISRIMNFYKPQMPGIKIAYTESADWVLENFKKDLDLFNSVGGYKSVERVIVFENAVSIQLRDNGTPVIYYFPICFSDAESAMAEIIKICNDLNITIKEMDL